MLTFRLRCFAVSMALAFAIASLLSPKAEAEDAPGYQLEAGTNVRVIDIGSEGTDELANAVKALNEKKAPEAASTTTEDKQETGSITTPSILDLPSVDNATPERETGKMHPEWLFGTWVINGSCEARTSPTANTVVIARDTATFGKETCRATALSSSQEKQVVILYVCGDKATSKQRVHRFERVEEGALLLNGFDRAVKCEGR